MKYTFACALSTRDRFTVLSSRMTPTFHGAARGKLLHTVVGSSTTTIAAVDHVTRYLLAVHTQHAAILYLVLSYRWAPYVT